jgi:hypothetical protein
MATITAEARKNLVSSVAVMRHESGCGHSMRVWFTIDFKYSNGRAPITVRKVNSRYVLDTLAKFGASPYQASQSARRGGTLNRDLDTLEITPNEATTANWDKHPIPVHDKF